jgi:hypothetical protein
MLAGSRKGGKDKESVLPALSRGDSILDTLDGLKGFKSSSILSVVDMIRGQGLLYLGSPKLLITLGTSCGCGSQKADVCVYTCD